LVKATIAANTPASKTSTVQDRPIEISIVGSVLSERMLEEYALNSMDHRQKSQPLNETSTENLLGSERRLVKHLAASVLFAS